MENGGWEVEDEKRTTKNGLWKIGIQNVRRETKNVNGRYYSKTKNG